MKVDLPAMVFQIKMGCQMIHKGLNRWLHYTVKWIDKASPYFQSSWHASAVLFGMNIIFFELALRICRFVDRMINIFYPFDETSLIGRKVRINALHGILILTIGIANCSFCNIMHIPLSYWKVAGISMITAFACLLWKIERGA